MVSIIHDSFYDLVPVFVSNTSALFFVAYEKRVSFFIGSFGIKYLLGLVWSNIQRLYRKYRFRKAGVLSTLYKVKLNKSLSKQGIRYLIFLSNRKINEYKYL